MAHSIRKRHICSYDMVEVPPECYALEDAQGTAYFCSARCLCVWSMLLVTKPNLPEDLKKIELDLSMPGGARLHYTNLRELARWAVDHALGHEHAGRT